MGFGLGFWAWRPKSFLFLWPSPVFLQVDFSTLFCFFLSSVCPCVSSFLSHRDSFFLHLRVQSEAVRERAGGLPTTGFCEARELELQRQGRTGGGVVLDLSFTAGRGSIEHGLELLNLGIARGAGLWARRRRTGMCTGLGSRRKNWALSTAAELGATGDGEEKAGELTARQRTSWES